MLNTDRSSIGSVPDVLESLKGERSCGTEQVPLAQSPAAVSATHDAKVSIAEDTPVEWNEEDIVLLHWRLLKEVGHLRDPETPLEEKLDTLRWIFTEDEKDNLPFSFVSCLKVVGCSPLSPMPYFGHIDPAAIRESISRCMNAWLTATLERYPSWVRDAVLNNPDWVESRLEKNPQWINEQIKNRTVQGDLFVNHN